MGEKLKQLTVLIGLIFLAGIGFFLFNKWENYQKSQPKSKPIAYVCSQDVLTSKCYEVPVDSENFCGDKCFATITRIYWPNGGYANISSPCIEEQKKIICADNEGRVWAIQFSGSFSTEKYYPDGSVVK